MQSEAIMSKTTYRTAFTLGLSSAAILGSVALSAVRAHSQATSGVAGDRPECAIVTSRARMQAYGFDHVVRIQNTCPSPLSCSVTTDVNPTASRASLQPGETTEVLMWRGSPASAFTAHVDCTDSRRPPRAR
jgi:hypothetical protein